MQRAQIGCPLAADTPFSAAHRRSRRSPAQTTSSDCTAAVARSSRNRPNMMLKELGRASAAQVWRGRPSVRPPPMARPPAPPGHGVCQASRWTAIDGVPPCACPGPCAGQVRVAPQRRPLHQVCVAARATAASRPRGLAWRCVVQSRWGAPWPEPCCPDLACLCASVVPAAPASRPSGAAGMQSARLLRRRMPPLPPLPLAGSRAAAAS